MQFKEHSNSDLNCQYIFDLLAWFSACHFDAVRSNML